MPKRGKTKKTSTIGEEFEKITESGVKSDFESVEKKVEKIEENIVKTITKPFVSDKKRLSSGQKTADWIAKWAGSWTFIILFVTFLILWMALNSYFWFKYSFSGEPFDPYPFILLNLVLSCLAAMQAPVILMSQNRAAERDRLRAEYDYHINRKSEREIRDIKAQLDRIERIINPSKE